jgi:hypothetical protein
MRSAEGPSFGWDNAKIECSKCDGWTGLECPRGCGVRLVSTQAEDNAAFRQQMRSEERERRQRREARRAARKAGT